MFGDVFLNPFSPLPITNLVHVEGEPKPPDLVLIDIRSKYRSTLTLGFSDKNVIVPRLKRFLLR